MVYNVVKLNEVHWPGLLWQAEPPSGCKAQVGENVTACIDDEHIKVIQCTGKQWAYGLL